MTDIGYRAIADTTHARLSAPGIKPIVAADRTWSWDCDAIVQATGFQIVERSENSPTWQSTVELLRRLDRPFGSVTTLRDLTWMWVTLLDPEAPEGFREEPLFRSAA